MRKRDRERLDKLDRDLGHLERQVELLNHERKHRNRRDAQDSRIPHHEWWVHPHGRKVKLWTPDLATERPWYVSQRTYPDMRPAIFNTRSDAVAWLAWAGFALARGK